MKLCCFLLVIWNSWILFRVDGFVPFRLLSAHSHHANCGNRFQSSTAMSLNCRHGLPLEHMRMLRLKPQRGIDFQHQLHEQQNYHQISRPMSTALSARSVYADIISEQERSIWFRLSNTFLFKRFWDWLANPSLYNGIGYAALLFVIILTSSYTKLVSSVQAASRIFKAKDISNSSMDTKSGGQMTKSDGLEEFECEVSLNHFSCFIFMFHFHVSFSCLLFYTFKT